jgi:hypothetical protein
VLSKPSADSFARSLLNISLLHQLQWYVSQSVSGARTFIYEIKSDINGSFF